MSSDIEHSSLSINVARLRALVISVSSLHGREGRSVTRGAVPSQLRCLIHLDTGRLGWLECSLAVVPRGHGRIRDHDGQADQRVGRSLAHLA